MTAITPCAASRRAVRRPRGTGSHSGLDDRDQDDRCPMTMKDDYLRLMMGLISGMAIAVALVCALIVAGAFVS
ncbi:MULTISPECIES: hypothetical protein [unclassified Actinomadura]|uniref:hypothetical protein n=1 Tax=unclassified Actinomadura TaxID=2626254 RepID=UPI0010538394|nr:MULTISPECIES: hypothetical protein [unclassified Actinomadura]TDB89876.1 hypothetical protein E1266_29030 [Actinomadura sp. 7K534]TDC69858.1 hypothetical protein E1200_07150 [Actinomadura sp. GC306]